MSRAVHSRADAGCRYTPSPPAALLQWPWLGKGVSRVGWTSTSTLFIHTPRREHQALSRAHKAQDSPLPLYTPAAYILSKRNPTIPRKD